MSRFLVRRVLLALIVILGVLLITFVIARVIPGDPARLYAGGQRATADEVARASEELGLDEPLPVQFLSYVGGIVRGEFGTSFVTHRSVSADVGIFLPATLELVIPAMLIALLVGIPVGLLSGAKPRGVLDESSRFAAISGAALPPFWLAIVGQLLFAVWLGWLPVGGRLSSSVLVQSPIDRVSGFYLIDAVIAGNWAAWVDAARHMVLPVFVLAVYPTSLVMRQMRAAVADVMTEPYVTAARASGLSERTVLFRYVLRNAIVPTLTVLGLTFAASVTGTVLIEIIFSWPGIGRYVTESIMASDFPAVMTVTTIGTVGYVLINLAVDVVQAGIDPRIRLR